MKESEETPATDISDPSESKVQLPSCVSTFQTQLSNTWGSESNPEVELRSDSAVSAVSSRVRKLSAAGKPSERYILKGEVGRGGMGAILRIFDADLRRNLAMKVVLTRKAAASGEAAKTEAGNILRFIEEAQVTGQLDHPGVVPVHELGVDQDGQVYFTMRLVKGQELRKVFESVHADDPDWNMTRALGVLLKVCEAMSYAHEKGVVHRDLKPANIMVGRHGAVYVMDWGLAKVDGREDSHDVRLKEEPESISILRTDRRDLKHQGSESPVMTMDGTIIGTPFYMPPEQAAGRLEEVGPHSDVYSLGAMLYHLLSGRMPFHTPGDRVSPYTVLARVLQGSPTPVHELAPSVAPELVSICEKAMEREASKRYSNMGELAEDLRAYLENRVVQAHHTGALIELKKWVQRNKALAAMILAFVALSVGGSTTAAVVFGAKNETIRLARDEALDAKDLAEVAAQNEKSQRKLAQDNELRAKEAELKAETRAGELKLVADFQAQQLGSLDVPMMGVRMRRALLAAAPAERREELTRNVAGLNFTSLALNTLEENLFERTVAAIDAQFENQPLVQAQLLQSVASTLLNLGLLSMADDPQLRALKIRRKELTDDHPDTLSSVNNMGALLQSMGKPEDALPYNTEALEGCQRVLGDHHPGTLSSIASMGALLESVGKFDDALPYFTEALEGCRRVLGDNHPNTLKSAGNLGDLLKSMGKLEDALPYFTEALEGSRRVLRDDHPYTHASMNNMGGLLHSMGKFEDALPYFSEALEGSRRVLGNDHPSTLTSVNSMGFLLQSMGKFEDALPYYTEALEGSRRVLGDDHPNTLSCVSNMGLLLKDMGKFDAALPFYTEALEGSRRVLGDDNPETLISVNNMGGLLKDMGKHADALPYYTEGVESSRRVLGGNHPGTFSSVANMGTLLQSMGKFDEALLYFTEALEGRRRVLKNDHPNTLISMNNMGTLLQSIGKFDKALPYYTEALEGGRRVHGDNHPNTLMFVNNMEFLFEQWIPTLIAKHGKVHPFTIKAQRHQAIFFASSNRGEQAEVQLLSCLDRLLGVQREEHPDILQLFHDLATLYSQQGRTDESEGMYLECLNLREAALGEDHQATLESLEGLARLLVSNERYKEAAPLAKRLLALTPEESPALAGRQELLQLIESKQEK